MKSRFLATLIAILWGVAFGPIAHAALTTNNWSNAASGTWNWVSASNWQLGLAPNINQSAILITNQAGFMTGAHNRTVTIDSTTVSQPSTMTVSNVLISAPGTGAKGSHNTLFLDNAGLVTPLHILGSLGIASGGEVDITNSELLVGQPSLYLNNTVLIDGTLQLQSGSLIATDEVDLIVGAFGVGQMTVLDGTWQATEVDVGSEAGSQGTLTLAGGANTLNFLVISLVQGADGAVLMTGGSLTTAETDIGYNGTGQMTVSGGTWLAGSVNVGTWLDLTFGYGEGKLTLAGGTTVISGSGLVLDDFNIAYDNGTTGFVWLTGGQLITTNTSTFIGHGDLGLGQMIVSNGAWLARDVTLGYGYGTPGTFKMVGGTATVSSNFVVGDCANGSVGVVSVYRSTLAVTNASHTAVLDLENGTITVNASGMLVADVIVATNPCGVIFNAGGIISYRTLILDPNGDTDLDGLPN